MDAIKMIKDRRSVRKFKNETVDRELMKEIVDISRWAPSWANYQIARYTIVDDRDVIRKIAADGVKGFIYNAKVLENAKGVLVLSFVKGKSGNLVKYDIETSGANTWEIFDAGISCQTFCLTAHAKGVGTVIFGVIDNEAISKIVGLPSEETVAALVVYGYEDGKHADATPRKNVEEIVRFV